LGPTVGVQTSRLCAFVTAAGFAETIRRHLLGIRLERALRTIPVPARCDWASDRGEALQVLTPSGHGPAVRRHENRWDGLRPRGAVHRTVTRTDRPAALWSRGNGHR